MPSSRERRRVELVRDLEEDARAVAGARIAPGRAAMGEVAEDLERLLDDRRASACPSRRRDEAEPTGVVLECGIIQPLAIR